MYEINLVLEIVLFIACLVIVSKASDKYNSLLKEARVVLSRQLTDKTLALNKISLEIKSLRNKGFAKIILFNLLVSILILIVTFIGELNYFDSFTNNKLDRRFTKWLVSDITPYLIASGAQLLFFLFVHYVVLYVLKGRGTIDSRPADNQQFPFPW